MIKTEKQYCRAMRKMIRRVQSGEQINANSASFEDMEILSDCIRLGYVNGIIEESGCVLRTLDGKMRPRIFNNHIPLKGIAFLHPHPNWEFLIPTIISLIALVKSFLS